MIDCRYCGKQHQSRQCPAYGKFCKKCGKKNHFANVCRFSSQKQIKELEADFTGNYSDPHEFFRIDSLSSTSSKPKLTEHMIVKDDDGVQFSIAFTLDAGAEVNVLPKRFLDQMSLSLHSTNITLTGFGRSIVRPCGQTVMKCIDKANECHELTFYVSDVIEHGILGASACVDLNLLKHVMCSDAERDCALSLSTVHNIYSDLFTGYGTYDKEYVIATKPDVKGVVQPPHKISYALQPRLKEYLQKLADNDIIADVDKPTEWVHNIVVIEKKNKQLRICLDPKPLNAVILREHYNIPTPVDMQSKFSSQALFTVIDMKDAYWHVKLSPESSYLTTFHTPWGRRRFLRMPFGLSSASEVMQKRNEDTFGDIHGVHIIAYDLIIAA